MVRDEFIKLAAIHCPWEEVEKRMPNTCGGIRDKLIQLGWISYDRGQGDVTRSYNQGHVTRLRAQIRIEYATDLAEALDL